jgi:hypothetical protein
MGGRLPTRWPLFGVVADLTLWSVGSLSGTAAGVVKFRSGESGCSWCGARLGFRFVPRPAGRVVSGGSVMEIRECVYCRVMGGVGEDLTAVNGGTYACADVRQCQDRQDRSRPASECRLVSVKVVADQDDAGCFSVHPVWAGVDRPDTGGWLVRGKRIADRLTLAIVAGAAVSPTGITTDRQGRTYVQTRSHVLGRTMNADLRRLGY